MKSSFPNCPKYTKVKLWRHQVNKGVTTRESRLQSDTLICSEIYCILKMVVGDIKYYEQTSATIKRNIVYSTSVAYKWSIVYTRDVLRIKSHCFDLEKYTASKHETYEECLWRISKYNILYRTQFDDVFLNLWKFALKMESSVSSDQVHSTFAQPSKMEYFHHPAYSPDMAPSDYHLMPTLKHDLCGQHFATEEDLQSTVAEFFAKDDAQWCSTGSIHKLISRYNNCFDEQGDCVEK